MAKRHPISHVEWVTRDANRLQKFYGTVFNWKFSESGMPGYTMVDFGNKETGGGVFGIGDQPMPTGVTNYYTVDELGPHEEAIRANGGQVHRSNQEIPGIGWFSIAGDPDGNMFALWKQAPKPSKKEKKAAKRAQKKAAKAQKKEAKAQQKEAKAQQKKQQEAAKQQKKEQKAATEKAPKK
jgi:predicted enzyme related to lactoylglutathione lyase